jgi:hypothetical protein
VVYGTLSNCTLTRNSAWFERGGTSGGTFRNCIVYYNTAASAYSDADGLNNWQEWRCGTDPTNALSSLRLLTPVHGNNGLTVRWQSVTNRAYFLQRSTSSLAQLSFAIRASNIPGQSVTTTYLDTHSAGRGPFYYRVGVQD